MRRTFVRSWLRGFIASVVVGSSLALAACAPTVAPSGPLTAPPQFTGAAFIAGDGFALPMRSWLPEGKPTAVVLAVHGFNEYSKAFDKVPGAPGVGPTLSAQGIAVYAYDQRGFGASANHGIWPGRDALVNDFTAIARALKGQYPDVPLYVMGESMGGAVVMAALAQDKHLPVKGAILSAPAVWARSTMPLLYRVALWFGAHTMPKAKPTGEGLGIMPSDNIDMLRANGRDPQFIRATRIDAVYGLSDLMDEALSVSGKIHVPVLYLYGAHDQLIPAGPSHKAMTAMKASNKMTRTAIYPNGWHMLMRDHEAPVVLGDVAAFIADPRAPLPSGADLPSAQPATPTVQTAQAGAAR